jgi:hypothetical protein
MEAAGFAVAVNAVDDTLPYRTKYGIPQSLASCHTAVVGGYGVEGHVPAQDVKRLLALKPAAAGLAVPGMPSGAPGMQQGGPLRRMTCCSSASTARRQFSRCTPAPKAHLLHTSPHSEFP